MHMTIATTRCACSATACAWVSHARLGDRCDSAFKGDAKPAAWASIPEVGLCCPSCIAINRLRDAAPVEPIRWSRERGGFPAFE